MAKDQTISLFILISLFLVIINLVFQLIQFIFWLIIILKPKKNDNQLKYQELLALENINCQIIKSKFCFKFFNYNVKKNTLKLKNRDFYETTTWNKYQTLSTVVVVKWKNSCQKWRNVTLPMINLFYISGVFITIICAFLYYIPLWKQSTNNNINQEILSIFSFLGLLIIIMSWLFWTMFYEKFRKELMTLDAQLTYNEAKNIKYLTYLKACFPFADLMF